MATLILHHFDASPFAEKVRLTMGIKGLTWHSVQIPMVLPKPDLMPLTGGYRKTPTLQIGAEVYCDTRLIMDELDARFPTPALFPAAAAGIAPALASWSDRSFFEPGAALSMALNAQVPEDVLADRKAFFEFMDFDELDTCGPHMLGQFLAQVDLVERQLADGRPYALGATPCAVDVLNYFPLWMVRANVPDIGRWLEPFERTAAWEGRMLAIGNGTCRDMAVTDALGVANASVPAEGAGVVADPSGLRAGERVTVSPTDYGAVPVEGRLMGLSLRRITLRREAARVGPVNTHFPRAGYRIERV